ncbi:MAG: NAD(P)H-dependent oxidoreductase subunit E, partial [Nitrospirota bacterium]|nr:NAD(P)H-dependent oxidoreductase subunit E [Nitrospirota bacterium]
IDHISGSLNIREGETTPDGLFTLTPVECIASCAGAPAILINLERYENMTPEKFDRMIDSIRKREISSPPLEKGDERGSLE